MVSCELNIISLSSLTSPFLGKTFIKADHMDEDAGWGSYFPWGSIMVKPGCTLYMFRDQEFSGSR